MEVGHAVSRLVADSARFRVGPDRPDGVVMDRKDRFDESLVAERCDDRQGYGLIDRRAFFASLAAGVRQARGPSGSSPAPSTPPTYKASSTATSSRPTSSWPPTAVPRSPTSAWPPGPVHGGSPGSPRRQARAPPDRDGSPRRPCRLGPNPRRTRRSRRLRAADLIGSNKVPDRARRPPHLTRPIDPEDDTASPIHLHGLNHPPSFSPIFRRNIHQKKELSRKPAG
jgi:hypothetical protein